MAMVKITNGKDIYVVTGGAFENIFKRQGYRLVNNENDRPVDFGGNEKAENPYDELREKPISEWTQEELKMFVEKNKINISRAKKVSEVRDIVKSYLENNE